eukprot:m.12550 g.12550  ORF g.12550 m.12550 type:complete len:241 (+) comp4014_c0_seq1:201-923(+)
MSEFEKKKVSELKDLLKERGLDTSGKKAELVDRLTQHQIEQELEGGLGDDAAELEAIDDDVENVEDVDDVAITDDKVDESLASEEGHKDEEGNALTDDEKRAQRGSRFGTTSDGDKRKNRAARFGLASPELEVDLRKKRAQRFNLPSAEVDDEKRKERAQRFGTTKVADSEAEKRRQERAKRFGIDGNSSTGGNKGKKPKETNLNDLTIEHLEKMKSRLERFGDPNSQLATVEAAIALKQ